MSSAPDLERHLPDDLIAACIHCGFCLPSCPTYALTGSELSSPRGRIALMGAVASGALDLTRTFREEMWFCLDCRACETACPAGVEYGRLVEGARALIAERHPSRLERALVRFLFGSRRRLDVAAALLRPYSRSRLRLAARGLLGRVAGGLAEREELLPALERAFRLPGRQEPAGPTGARAPRVAFLEGCVQRHTYPGVNTDTVSVLVRNGLEVVVPPAQGCCGSLHAHGGDVEGARRLARRNLKAFEPLDDLEAVVVNAAGCGSFLKHVDRVFGTGDPDRPWAELFASKVRDVTELMWERGWKQPTGRLEARVTYHDPCHLVHGQRISEAPRAILASIPGLELVSLAESTWCCGSAGIYNLTHPRAARELLERKLDHVAATGATILATANPGCFVQLAAGLRRRRMAVKLAHPLSLLARSYAEADRAAADSRTVEQWSGDPNPGRVGQD